MNVLLNNPPTEIEIGKTCYQINYDYRTCLKIILAFEDNELTQTEKTQIMLELLYKQLPNDIPTAIDKAILFLDCGEIPAENDTPICPKRLYSFSHDAKYIFSAIKYSHSIDLDEYPDMHWWKFNFLMFDLDENCFFNRLIYMRRQKYFGKLTKDENEIYNSMQSVFELPVVLTSEEQEQDDEFMKLLKEGEKNGRNC